MFCGKFHNLPVQSARDCGCAMPGLASRAAPPVRWRKEGQLDSRCRSLDFGSDRRPRSIQNPKGPWTMTQTWHDLLFAHWPVPPDLLHPLVPRGVDVDTCEGSAWVGLVAFRLSGIRLRGLPEIPFVAGFPEVNARTYVVAGRDTHTV